MTWSSRLTSRAFLVLVAGSLSCSGDNTNPNPNDPTKLAIATQPSASAQSGQAFAVQPVVSDLLGVADALHGAIEGLKDSEHERRVAEGLKLVERELTEVLGRHGVARIDALGKPFDTALHEAILEIESDAPERTVVQVTRPGFTLHGRVVRPAAVIVSKAKAKEVPPPSAAAKRG